MYTIWSSPDTVEHEAPTLNRAFFWILQSIREIGDIQTRLKVYRLTGPYLDYAGDVAVDAAIASVAVVSTSALIGEEKLT